MEYYKALKNNAVKELFAPQLEIDDIMLNYIEEGWRETDITYILILE